MNLAAIRHRSTGSDCYALDESTVVFNLWTDRGVQAVTLVCEDPFIHELHRRREWEGKPVPMRRHCELERQTLWTAEIRPAFKRLQYYFIAEEEGERVCVFENKICPEAERSRISTEYFKFPWLNPSDVIAPPAWVRDTVWYQIMPDRFCRGAGFVNNGRFREWGDFSNPGYNDLYGGDLRGIADRLPYLKELGVSGIYLTPIFLSNSYHKYNTFDYYTVDPDFGGESALQELVREAHKLGVRVMLDAVFNHCGTEFFAWKDVCEKGRASRYFDWFFINSDDFRKHEFTVADGRYYTFSFWAPMPKLNTNNPEVQRYFADLCAHWVRDYDIDGIRFDVGDEVSHSFLRAVRAAVLAAKPDVFLPGEIWADAIGWLNGTEYDSVMNYPFSGCVGDFWRDRSMTAVDFMHRLNFCRTLYPRQVNEVLFSFLDTHDTARVRESCRGRSELLQKLTILLTAAGTPCLYYGTEIAMRGKRTPYNRSTMPWDEIDSGRYDSFRTQVAALVHLRGSHPDLKRDDMEFLTDSAFPRLVRYRKGAVTVSLNAGDEPVSLPPEGSVLFSHRYRGGTLGADGVLITTNSESERNSYET